ncbi:Nuclear export mediator factor Nemf, partial [Smittium culicis]
MVVIESGTRIHSTEQALEKNPIPSHFSSKLRKYLNSRRLTGIKQLGFDRIIDMEFASGLGVNVEGTYHLICEFYSSSYILNTLFICLFILFLGTVRISDELTIEPGKIYNYQNATKLKPPSKEQIISTLMQAGPKDSLKKVLGYIP